MIWLFYLTVNTFCFDWWMFLWALVITFDAFLIHTIILWTNPYAAVLFIFSTFISVCIFYLGNSRYSYNCGAGLSSIYNYYVGRQKRRNKKQMKEEVEKEKRSVSFCPDDSIINISDTVISVESKTVVSNNVFFFAFFEYSGIKRKKKQQLKQSCKFLPCCPLETVHILHSHLCIYCKEEI